MGKAMDKVFEFLWGKVEELIAIGVWALMSALILTLSHWNPIVIFLVLFAFGLVVVKSLRVFQIKKEDKIAHAIQLIANRPSQPKPNLLDDFKVSGVIWALWYTGNTARSEKVFDIKTAKGKVLLLKPGTEFLAWVANRAGNPKEELVTDILYVARHALMGKYDVGFNSERVDYSFTMFDPTPTHNIRGELVPNSEHAWMTIQQFEPDVAAGERRTEKIYRSKEEQKYDGYLKEFEKFWKRRSLVELNDNEKIVCEGTCWEVNNISKPIR